MKNQKKWYVGLVHQGSSFPLFTMSISLKTASFFYLYQRGHTSKEYLNIYHNGSTIGLYFTESGGNSAHDSKISKVFPSHTWIVSFIMIVISVIHY